MSVLHVATLALAGVLAGEEFVVRWGVAPALRALDDAAHLRARIALVRRLRVVVPAVIVPTVIATVVTVLGGVAQPAGWLGLGLLAVFVLCSALGTVPINTAVADWDADAPPPRWRAVVRRWEAIDVARSSAALLAFVALLLAV